jgi:hypothetical protein
MDASLLAGWDNFYVITGSAAGGLTGLTFVVIALITDARRVRPAGLNTFVTPTIVHFCIVLALAAYLSMPSQQLWTVSAGFGIAGAVGLGICARIAFGLRHMPSDYRPVWEDWLWNLILPTVAYGALLLAADLIWYRRAASLYSVAAVSLLLLFIGIHNAWDIAVWMAISKDTSKEPGKDPAKEPPRGPTAREVAASGLRK